MVRRWVGADGVLYLRRDERVPPVYAAEVMMDGVRWRAMVYADLDARPRYYRSLKAAKRAAERWSRRIAPRTFAVRGRVEWTGAARKYYGRGA